MTKTRKPHTIVRAAQNAASELNDLLNAIGLRVSLLRHELRASANEAEMIRLAELVNRACHRVHLLGEYARAEELVASMRPGRTRRLSKPETARHPAIGSELSSTNALFIAESSIENSAIRDCL